MPENPGGSEGFEYEKKPPKHKYKPLTTEEELGDMHFSTEHYSVALEYYEKALQKSHITAIPSDLVRFYRKISNCYYKKGLLRESMAFLQSAASHCPEEDEIAQASIACRRGFILLEHGESEKALHEGLVAYRVLRLTDEHKEVADTQVLMAICYARLGKNDEAEQCFLDALSTFRRINDAVGEANILNNLGLFHKNACRWGRSLDFLQRALRLCDEFGLTQVRVRVTLNLGIVHLKRREFAEAVSSLSSARKMARQAGDDLKYTRATLMLGVAEIRTSNFTAAEKHLLEARVLSERRSYKREIALSDEFLGDLMLERGDLEGAEENYSIALAAGKKLNPNGDIVAEVLRRMAHLYLMQRRPEDAVKTGKRAVEIATKCGEKHELGFAQRTVGLAYVLLRKREEAERHIEISVSTFLGMNNPYEANRSTFLLGDYLQKRNDRHSMLRAKKLIEDALSFFEKNEDFDDLAESHFVMARVERELGNRDECLLHIYESQRLAEDLKNRKLQKRIKRVRKMLEDEVAVSLSDETGEFSLSEEFTGLFSKKPQIRSYMETILGDLMQKMSAGHGFVAMLGGANGRRKVHTLVRSGVDKDVSEKLARWFLERGDIDTSSGLLLTDAEHDKRLAAIRDILPGHDAPIYFHPICSKGEPYCLLFFQYPDGKGEPPKLGSKIEVAATYAGFIGFLIKNFTDCGSGRRELDPALVRRGLHSIITRDERMLRILSLAERVAESDSTVLLMGETGTGKGLIAETIHRLSPRRNKKFIHVNCAALPENIIESELFGHVKGSFTGAYANKKGLFEEADGGTVFLDEIGKTPLPLQGKLLQFLDSKKIRPVGGNEMTDVDVRLIFASKVDLLALCADGRMLEDFYYRINDFPLTIPPLRDRTEDIEILARHYINLVSQQMEKRILGISNEAVRYLESYGWPGNVRELEKIIKRAIILADDNTLITPDLLLFNMGSDRSSEQEPSSSNLHDLVRALERRTITETLRRFDWNRSAAAREIGISYPTLLKKIREYEIEETH